MVKRLALLFAVLLLCAAAKAMALASWRPAGPNPLSPWGAAIKPQHVWSHYPRPQMRRKSWKNLNGLWQYAISPRADGIPTRWQGSILVPFVAQSKLSGVDRKVGITQRLWYRTEFKAPLLRHGGQLLLHFGGAMYRTHVFLNGRSLIVHDGDYNPFTVNVTRYLKPGTQTLIVSCWNPANRGSEPCGKQQVGKPGFTMHLVSTGLWQTVWLEKVPAQSIRSLRITPRAVTGTVAVTVAGRGTVRGCKVQIVALAHGHSVAESAGLIGQRQILHIAHAKLWSPAHPFLYSLQVRLLAHGKIIDRVTSYFGMRTIQVKKAPDGYMRIFLNGKPLFLFGPLEEGYWPDGAYTPPSNAAMIFDIKAMKRVGFNMCRKHQLVAPARWYYLCDKLGFLVWQDMPAAFGDKSRAAHAEFRRELSEMVTHLHNDPSVVIWCIFNEGWGQHDTNRILRWVHRLDPTRLVDGPSGWTDHGYGAMKDAHIYPGPGMWPAMKSRASVLGESGRFPCPIAGHIWPYPGEPYQTGVPGRGTAAGKAIRRAWFKRYTKWAMALRPLIERGLAAAVYTRWADQVSDHCTGLITCDRRVFKFRVGAIARVNKEITHFAAQAALLPHVHIHQHGAAKAGRPLPGQAP